MNKKQNFSNGREIKGKKNQSQKCISVEYDISCDKNKGGRNNDLEIVS